MDVQLAPAGPTEEPLLLEMMREFYACEGLRYDEAVARRALAELRAEPELGAVFLLRADGETVGYAVLTHGFSLEFHGRDALVDELYVREAHRGRGVGRETLALLEEQCRAAGVHALHLEVDHVNERAKRLYHSAGYRDHDRHLLTRWLEG